jgi:hypothetical protein
MPAVAAPDDQADFGCRRVAERCQRLQQRKRDADEAAMVKLEPLSGGQIGVRRRPRDASHEILIG